MSEIDIGKELVQSLVNRISWLDSVVRGKERDVAAAKKDAAMWKRMYEDARAEGHEMGEKTDKAIDRFYEFLGLDRSE